MHKRLVPASVIAVVMTAALLPGSGLGSTARAVRGRQTIPAGLAYAIQARLGAGPIRSSSAAGATSAPDLGYSVALSADGTTAIVGAPGVGHSKGAAYVYHVSGAGSWSSTGTPAAALTYKHGGPEDGFGAEVAMSADGTTAVVGAPLAGSFSSGEIYVFHVAAEDAWVSSSTPTATLIPTNDPFAGIGIALALSPDGTTLVAGAPSDDGNAGGAYVFHVAGEGAWISRSTPTAFLRNEFEPRDDCCVGLAVAISADGTTALLSDAGNQHGRGGAYVYHAAAEDAWTSSSTPTAILSDPNSPSDGFLGFSVALSGDGTVALLGAPGLFYEGIGSADVFHASGEAAWTSTSTPTATLTNAGGWAGAGMGAGVVLSSDGTTALVTAPGVDAARGAAYVFHVAGADAWASSSAPTATLTDSGGRHDDYLGIAPPALSPDGATTLVGAPGVRWETGAVDVFHVADASSWASSSAPGAILSNSALAVCLVPRLKGLTVAAAKSVLEERDCRLGKVSRVQAKGTRGRVVSQSPTPGSRVPAGSKVSVKIEK